MYAGIFTVSLSAAYFTFYVLVLYGSHGISREALSAIREDFREYFAWPLTGVIFLSAIIGWLMAKRAVSGIVELTRAATAVSDGALTSRVPVKGQLDEIDRLATTFNSMLERIQLLIAEMKGVNDNIAHDLKSPITRMRGVAESMLIREASTEEYPDMAGSIIEECDRLLGMINAMLDISEAESGLSRPDMTDVDITTIVYNAVGLFQPFAEDRGITMKVNAPDSLHTMSDIRKLQRILANLLDNAIKFTLPGGVIAISVSTHDRSIVMIVRDTGIGISEADLGRVFDRFFRAEKSRSKPGNGLGLSLAKAFSTSLGGSIQVASTPGEGSTFTVILPKEHSLSRHD